MMQAGRLRSSTLMFSVATLIWGSTWLGIKYQLGIVALDDLKLRPDIAEKLARIPRLFFYHCRDDDVVPFAHLALNGARIPRALTRVLDRGGTSLATT